MIIQMEPISFSYVDQLEINPPPSSPPKLVVDDDDVAHAPRDVLGALLLACVTLLLY